MTAPIFRASVSPARQRPRTPFGPDPRVHLPLGSALIAVAALVLVSCGSGDDGGAPDVPVETSDEVTLPISAVTTSLIDAGVEPRTLFAPAVTDDSQSVTLEASSTVLQQINGGEEQDFSTPPLTVPLTATGSEGDDGVFLTDMTLGTPTSPDATLTSNLASSAGSAAGFTHDSVGAVTALRITPAAQAPDIARSAIEQALGQAAYRAIAFPAEPVGAGARWTMTQEVVSSIALQQVTTVTVDDITDGIASLSLSVVQTPVSPQWELPDNGGTLNIETFTLAGTGSLRVDSTQPLPISGSVTVGGDQSYRDAVAGTLLGQTTSNTVTWTDTP